MIHGLITLLVAVMAYVSRLPAWVPLLFAAGFAGREEAQAEYRWIATFGKGLRANMPWWGGFDWRVWNVKSLADWILPLSVALIFWLITRANCRQHQA